MSPGRKTALERLREWAAEYSELEQRREQLDQLRPALIRDAYEETGNALLVAETAGVSRPTVYKDLREKPPRTVRQRVRRAPRT